MENTTNKDIPNSFIKKFPYLCPSQNLVDIFLIIGYDEDSRTKEIQKEVELTAKANDEGYKGNEPNYFSVYQNKLEASILSSVCSKEPQVMLEYDLITTLIFPTPPPVYYIVDGPNSPKKYDPNQYSVVFFMNSDTLEAKSKIPFHGYSYIFYEKKEEKIEFKSEPNVPRSLRVYVPKAFTFISQFPYFSQYYLLAKSIHDLYQLPDKEVEIPIEILLFNIINFTPAPINYNMNISFLPISDLASIKKNFETQSKQPPSSDTTIPAVNNNPIDTKPAEIGNFPALSGYPLFDFNLSEIFNILPLENIVEILIFNFLEIDTLFFSKNIEVLNLVMYIISALNYPCNDTIYLWHVVSVSKKELEDSSASSKFIGKPFTTMVGVNASYSETIDTSQFTKAMFIADLDKKEFSFKYSQGDTNEQEDIKKLIKFYIYIDKIINDKSIINIKNQNQNSLENYIKKLVSVLEEKCKKVIHANYSYGSQIIPKFLIENVSNQTNKATQEVFYEFILNVLKTIYSGYKLTAVMDDNVLKNNQPPKYVYDFDFNDSNLTDEEKIFYELFQSCTKAGSYLKNFLSLHTSMDLYHIPLLFSEEFLQLKEHKDRKEEDTEKQQSRLYEVNKHFEIIDNFYIKDSKPIQINFKEFYVFYNDELKEKFFNETVDSRVITPTKKKVSTKQKYIYNYKNIELDKEVLFKYIYYLNGLSSQKLKQIFPTIGFMANNSIKTTRYIEVAQQVELSFMEKKEFTMEDLISLSIITFYSLTVYCQSEAEFNRQFEIIFELLLKLKYCFRKYIIMAISLYYQHAFYLRSMKKNYSYLLIGYHRLLEIMVNKECFPNEELSKLIEAFEKIDDQNINYGKYLNKSFLQKNDQMKKKSDWITSKEDDTPIKKTSSISNENSKSLHSSYIAEVNNPKQTESLQADSQLRSSRVSTPNQKKTDEQSFPNELTKEDMFKINEKRPYLFKIKNNYCRDGMKKEDAIMKSLENSLYFEGDLHLTCPTCEKPMSPRILFHHKVPEFEFEYEIFCPLKIYKQTNQQLNAYLKDMKSQDLSFDILKKLMINLLFYQMNMSSLQVKSDMLILLNYQLK